MVREDSGADSRAAESCEEADNQSPSLDPQRITTAVAPRSDAHHEKSHGQDDGHGKQP